MLYFNILMLKSVFGLWLKKDDRANDIWLMFLSKIESWLFVVFISIRVFYTNTVKCSLSFLVNFIEKIKQIMTGIVIITHYVCRYKVKIKHPHRNTKLTFLSFAQVTLQGINAYFLFLCLQRVAGFRYRLIHIGNNFHWRIFIWRKRRNSVPLTTLQ